MSPTGWKILSLAVAVSWSTPALSAGLPTPHAPAVKPDVKPAPKAPVKRVKKKVVVKRPPKKAGDKETEEVVEEDGFEDTKFEVGLGGGLDIGLPGGEATDKLASKIGFNAGLKFMYQLASFADVESGLGYTTKGYTESLDDSQNSNTLTVKVAHSFSYVELPLMMRFSVPDMDIKPYLSLGLYLGFLAGSAETISADSTLADGSTESFTTTRDIPGASSFDAGLKVDLGVDWRLTDLLSAYLEAGYERGFMDPVDETKGKVEDRTGKLPQKNGAAVFTALKDETKNLLNTKPPEKTAGTAYNPARILQNITVTAGVGFHF